jgi:flagellar assembly factor FliW
MRIETRYFGEVEIGEEKILHFTQGIFGFEEYQDFTILYDVEEEGEPFFSWLQCVTEKGLAFPIVNPFKVREDYNPIVEDALLEPLGEFQTEDLLVFLLATVPSDPKKTSVNMKAPLIINAANRRGMQLIVENEDYKIKHMLLEDEEK